jgi:hypothetical protein
LAFGRRGFDQQLVVDGVPRVHAGNAIEVESHAGEVAHLGRGEKQFVEVHAVEVRAFGRRRGSDAIAARRCVGP